MYGRPPPGSENVGENGNSGVGKKRSALERKKGEGGGTRAGRLRAGKENIRSPFIFINKTSRRVRSDGNQDAPGGTSCDCVGGRSADEEVFAAEETRQMR